MSIETALILTGAAAWLAVLGLAGGAVGVLILNGVGAAVRWLRGGRRG